MSRRAAEPPSRRTCVRVTAMGIVSWLRGFGRPSFPSESGPSAAALGRAAAGLLFGLTLLAGFAADADAQTRYMQITAPADEIEGSSATSDRFFKVSLSSPVQSRVDFTVCFTGRTVNVGLLPGTNTVSGHHVDLDGGSMEVTEDYQPLLGSAPQTSNCVPSHIPAGRTAPDNAHRVGIRVNGDTQDAENDEVTATLSLQNPPWNVHLSNSDFVRKATHTILKVVSRGVV